MKFYATKNADSQGRIEELADIREFENEAEAREWLLENEDAGVTVIEGTWSDCWLKSFDPQIVQIAVHGIPPFTPEQMRIRRPGEHPGLPGCSWVTPIPSVLTLGRV